MSAPAVAAGIVVGVAFLIAIIIGGLGHAESVGLLITGGAVGWALERKGKQSLIVFVIAIAIVVIAWLWSVGALSR
jgi:hypothetical protein